VNFQKKSTGTSAVGSCRGIKPVLDPSSIGADKRSAQQLGVRAGYDNRVAMFIKGSVANIH
jgi:hypothetical protein